MQNNQIEVNDSGESSFPEGIYMDFLLVSATLQASDVIATWKT